MVSVKDVVIEKASEGRIQITVKGKNLILLINEDGNGITNINANIINVFNTDKIRNLQSKDEKIYEVQDLIK